ncbi:hypothetical protein CYMTET_43982 [Cymbomonas tetramitiformis]|uniref:Uncharacterized protein n=1 Tax=Cymbomonas tetramitiformis TaxID=36881 RepID=A0AAE0C125_9CHLO|nr:hypothetical protein CYMTET_43982 [Cymbomonas tetramitiformis]
MDLYACATHDRQRQVNIFYQETPNFKEARRLSGALHSNVGYTGSSLNSTTYDPCCSLKGIRREYNAQKKWSNRVPDAADPSRAWIGYRGEVLLFSPSTLPELSAGALQHRLSGRGTLTAGSEETAAHVLKINKKVKHASCAAELS